MGEFISLQGGNQSPWRGIAWINSLHEIRAVAILSIHWSSLIFSAFHLQWQGQRNPVLECLNWYKWEAIKTSNDAWSCNPRRFGTDYHETYKSFFYMTYGNNLCLDDSLSLTIFQTWKKIQIRSVSLCTRLSLHILTFQNKSSIYIACLLCSARPTRTERLKSNLQFTDYTLEN